MYVMEDSTDIHVYLMFIPSGGLLPKTVTHYVIPDPQIVKDYLEMFETPDIQGIIFTQTAVQTVRYVPQGVLSLKLTIVFIISLGLFL